MLSRTLWILFVLLAVGAFWQAVPVEANTSGHRDEASLLDWQAYSFEEVPAGGLPGQWKPFAAIGSDPEEARSNGDLWLRASLPDAGDSAGHLLIYYYMIEKYEITLYVDGVPVFVSDNPLPSGFISWRMISYESEKSGQILLARLSPHRYLEKGFEVWSGTPNALTLKQLRTEAPAWGGAILMTVFGLISLLFYLLNRRQILFVYFSLFIISIAIDLTVLWGGWQFVVGLENLRGWGAFIHFNWYMGHAFGILITYAIVGTPGSRWIRNLGYAVMFYAVAAFAGWALFGDKIQLLFYQLFYDYVSAGLLLVLAVVLVRALRKRRDAEIKVFAVGNALFIGGLAIGRLLSGQFGLISSKHAFLTSDHALAQIGWTFIGFTGAMGSLGIIMGMRLMHLAQLRSTNAELSKLNGELRIANGKLSRIEKIRSDMYSEVSHELNTPITTIKGYVQLMLNGTIPKGETRYLQIIRDKTLVMERMVDDMLEMARLENNHTSFEFEQVPFADFFARICGKLHADMSERGYLLQWTPFAEPLWPERVATIQADPMRVEQVFANLLSNARKFMPGGGTVFVQAAVQDTGTAAQSVMVRVRDTGCGILPEEQEHIFERYYRGQAAKAATAAGTGLGLPICRAIMRAHEGEIGLEQSSDQGSTFYVRFPLRLLFMADLESEETV